MATRELISNINLDRILWCCDEVNISLETLSTQLKISLKTLETTKLSFTQLSNMADYFGYGRLFFLNQESPQPQKIHSVAFRSLANQKITFDHKLKKLVEQVECHRNIYLGLLQEINEQHPLQLPNLTGSIKEKAITVRGWLGIEGQKEYEFLLTPGRYVGAEDLEEDSEPFAEKIERLTNELKGLQIQGINLDQKISKNLEIFAGKKND